MGNSMDMNRIKNLYGPFALLGISFVLLYFPFLRTMYHDWGSNPNYSHGYLIPFISGYLVYSLKEEFTKLAPVPSHWGLVLILLACFQLIIAKIGSEYFLQRTSIIPLFLGICLFLYGKDITLKLFIPIIYLIFMIPLPAIIWNKLAFPLQLFASNMTEQVIRISGMPVLREGNILTLPTITLEVVDACSGIRSLATMIALSIPVSFLMVSGRIRKILLFLSSIPVAIVVNIFRLCITAWFSVLFGDQFAQGFLHEFSGMVTFILGLTLLFFITQLLNSKIFN